MKIGLKFTGIRFHDDGDSGVTVIRDIDWRYSTDVNLLKRLICVDVAGNVAERILNCLQQDAAEPVEPLSAWFDGRLSSNPAISSDFVWAARRADRLGHVLHGAPLRHYDEPDGWLIKKALLEQCEKAVEKTLSQNIEALQSLSKELMKGPMTAKAIRKIVGKIK
jgi:hypothetical protein